MIVLLLVFVTLILVAGGVACAILLNAKTQVSPCSETNVEKFNKIDASQGQCALPEKRNCRPVSNKTGILYFSLMVSDQVSFAKIYNTFFAKATKPYHVLIHRSNPIGELYGVDFKHTVLPTVYSSWEDTRLIMRACTTIVANDPLAAGMYTLSSSCVPVKSFDHIYDILTHRDVTLMRYANAERTKSSSWSYVPRHICKLHLDTDPAVYMDGFLKHATTSFKDAMVTAKGGYAEMEFPALLNHFDIDSVHETNTFDCWNLSALSNKLVVAETTPAFYKKLTESFIREAHLATGVCFLRKVDPSNKQNIAMLLKLIR